MLPMTHQVMPLDREMANECGADFPVIIGGHDHQPYLQTVNGCVVTKQGADATIIGVVDLTWAGRLSPRPSATHSYTHFNLSEAPPRHQCLTR